jgi:hypothetical protein
MDVEEIVTELRWAASDFRDLLDHATSADLRRRSNGTRWTNEQLLFHMLFGYLLVRNLMGLVWLFGRLPDQYSRRFAAALNAVTRPFHVVNYLGSLGGARILGHARMERTLDRVVAGLVTRLKRQRADGLARGMHFPVGWDPYFRDHMTLADVLHYATEHYRHHRGQLALAAAQIGGPAAAGGGR